MENSDMIAELYSLRAGLSLIAQEKDKLDAEISLAETKRTIDTEQARFVADTKIAKSAEAVRQAERNLAEREKPLEINADELSMRSEAKNKAWTKYCVQKKQLDELRESTSAEKRKRLKDESKHNLKIFIIKVLLLTLNIAIPIIAVLNSFLFDRNRYLFLALAITSVGMIIITFFIKIFDGIDDLAKLLIRVGNGFFIAFCIALTLIGFLSSKTEVCIGLSFGAFIFSIPFFISALVKSCGSFGFLKSVYGRSNKKVESLSYLEREVAVAEQEYENARKEYDTAQQAQTSNHNIVRQAQNELRNAKATYDKTVCNVESEYDVTCAKINEQYEMTCTAAKDVHSEIGSAIYDLLVKQYGKLLDTRDWRIIDLIIWQLETGRADTLKEALQLADRETQTDRIIASVNSAANYIGTTIRDGLHGLQTTIDNNFRTLAHGFAAGTSLISRQLDKLSERMTASASALSEQMNLNAESSAALFRRQIESLHATNQNIEQLVSQASLNTALLEKSSESSQTLVSAVEKLRREQKNN